MTTMTATRKTTSQPRAAPPADDAPVPPWGVGDPTADPIHHTLAELAKRLPMTTAAVMLEVDSVVRDHWGSERLYLCKRPTEGRRHRDQQIFSDYQRGERPGLLARRYKLSVQRILQIVAEQRSAP